MSADTYPPGPQPSDYDSRVELRHDPNSPKSNAVVLLARLLRRLRDRDLAASARAEADTILGQVKS